MARPKGAMGSPYSGMAEQMRTEATNFNTVGTDQKLEDLSKKEVAKETPEVVEQPPIAEDKSQDFNSSEISQLVSALAKIANIKGASAKSIIIEIGGLEVKVVK
jgi:hypothetical protein